MLIDAIIAIVFAGATAAILFMSEDKIQDWNESRRHH